MTPPFVTNAATNAEIGQNSNLNFGTLGLNRLYTPREILLSLRLVF